MKFWSVNLLPFSFLQSRLEALNQIEEMLSTQKEKTDSEPRKSDSESLKSESSSGGSRGSGFSSGAPVITSTMLLQSVHQQFLAGCFGLSILNSDLSNNTQLYHYQVREKRHFSRMRQRLVSKMGRVFQNVDLSVFSIVYSNKLSRKINIFLSRKERGIE